jgi:hypothetical protein
MIGNTALRIDLIRPKPFLGQETIDHRVGESGGMAAGLPDLRVHDDGRFQSHDIIAALGHDSPPIVFYIALQVGAERAVIPKTVDAAVNFRRLKDKPPSLAQRDNPFHQVIRLGVHHSAIYFFNGRMMSIPEAGRFDQTRRLIPLSMKIGLPCF